MDKALGKQHVEFPLGLFVAYVRKFNCVAIYPEIADFLQQGFVYLKIEQVKEFYPYLFIPVLKRKVLKNQLCHKSSKKRKLYKYISILAVGVWYGIQRNQHYL